MYRNVRTRNQRKHDVFAQSVIWNIHKPENNKQRELRRQADLLIERQHGTPGRKAFQQHQMKERNKRFFASQEWFEFRMATLHKKDFACEQCGRRCGIHDVKLIMPILSHFHLRLNPINVSVKCRSGCRRRQTIKRERL